MLTVVLGPGVSIHAGFPTLTQLIEPLRQELRLSGPGPGFDSGAADTFYVAQIFVDRFGRDTLVSRIVQELDQPLQPTRIHKSLARMAPSNVFTTNCDRLMETALENAGKPYRVIACDASEIDGPTGNDTLVTKLYGDITSPEEIVSTKSDVVNYQKTRRKILDRFKNRLQDSEVLFIGTSMRGASLEWIFDRVLQELRGEYPKRQILVEDWDDSLRDYYRVYSLEPVPLKSWDEVVAFLNEIGAMVEEQAAEYSSADAGPLLVSVKRYDEMVDEAVKGLEQEYVRLLALFNKGARASLRTSAEELWKRVESKEGEKFRPTKVNVLLLLARIFLQTGDEVDTETAQSYVEEARSLVGDARDEAHSGTEAILAYFTGEVASALKILETLDNETAHKLRIGFLMSSKRFDECELLIADAAKSVGEDEEWDRVRAEFHMRRGEYDTAANLIAKWVEGPSADVASVELAGRIHWHRANERHRRFCREHHLFENFSVVLLHDHLIDCNSARLAAGYFQQVGEKLGELDEHERAAEFLELAFGLLYNCRVDAKELDALSETLQDPKTAEWGVALKALTHDENLAALDLKDLDQALHEHRNSMPLLSKIKQWAVLKGKPAEAAELIERHWQSGSFSTHEQQTAATFMLAELWHEAKQPEPALQAIRRLDFPKEFGFYPKILEVAHYLFLENQAGAEKLVDELSSEYSNHPVVLAMLCDYRGRQEAWEVMGNAAAKLFDVLKIPQTAVFYLTALGQQKKWIAFLEVLSEAESAGIDLDPLWTHINRARALLALDETRRPRRF